MSNLAEMKQKVQNILQRVFFDIDEFWLIYGPKIYQAVLWFVGTLYQTNFL
jgi:hypothetical protein